MKNPFKKPPGDPLPAGALTYQELKNVITDKLIHCIGLQPVASGYNFGTLFFGDKKLVDAISEEVVSLCIEELKKKVSFDLKR